MNDLLAALCLTAVFEGLFLFVAPDAWKRAAEQMLNQPSARVRVIGMVILLLGLGSLWLVRGG